MVRRVGTFVALVALLWSVAAPAARAEGWWPPVPGPVVRGFDPPTQAWLPGHRGVDLQAGLGEPVRASRAGQVVFAGVINDRGVVVVSHGDLRTTYEPVTAQVRVGTSVGAGQVVGTLELGHACGNASCLHWGLKRGEEYLDPLAGVTDPTLLLLPESAVAAAEAAASARVQAGSGTFTRPVPGPITSPYGMRFHPIFKEWRLHAGVDFRAGCGTPIRAAAAGRVISVSFDSSGGHRLVLGHPDGVTTHYLHAQGYQVREGTSVAPGDVVGTVGSTGWSTGCHLHFTVKVNGESVNPATYL